MAAGEPWLILADNRRAPELATRLQRQARVVLAGPATDTDFVRTLQSESYAPETSPVDRRDVTRDSSLSGVVHCWSLDAGSLSAIGSSDLDRTEGIGCLSALHLFQGLAGSGTLRRAFESAPGGAQHTGGDRAGGANTDLGPRPGNRTSGTHRRSGEGSSISILRSVADEADDSGEMCGAVGGGSDRLSEGELTWRACRVRSATALSTSSASVRMHLILLTGGFGALGLLTARWMAKSVRGGSS